MKKLLLLSGLLLCLTYLTAQTNQTMKSNDYSQLWEQVTSFEEQSLPKSASEQVDKIMAKAIAEKNNPQVIKAIIYKGKYDLAIDGQNDTLIFRNLNEMLQKSTDVVEKSVLHSMLGELYLQYYQKSSWEIGQRTALGDFVPADMKEWTKNIFYDKIVENLNASLQAQRELEQAQTKSYAEVVELGNDSRRFFPSMFAFLALRAIDFYPQIASNEDLSKILARKQISQESLFSPSEEFTQLSFNPQPKEYILWALETYRKLLVSLQTRKMDKSVVLVELKKSDYLRVLYSAYEKYAFSSLQTLLDKWKDNEFSVEIIDNMADFYLQPVADTPENQEDKQIDKTKALYELLQTTIAKFPNYERIDLLNNRLSQLIGPSLSMTGKAAFSLKSKKNIKIAYRNLSKLTVSIYKADAKSQFLKNYNNSNAEIDKKLVKKFDVSLPSNPPYINVEDSISFEINEYGAYFLTIETDRPEDNTTDNSNFWFSVTDISTFARAVDKRKYEIVAVDRISGKPLENARVDLYKHSGNWQNPTLQLFKEFVTDKMGVATLSDIDEVEKNNLFYHVVLGKDSESVLSRIPYFFQYSANQPTETEQLSIFTDRGIYRPGQTVYFKAISAKLNEEQAIAISSKEYTVELNDANGQKIADKKCITNEFGSISGEFVLPQSTLSGYFNLKIGESLYSFRVEEYKRPTFEITFDKIDETYKFGEQVTLQGKAESFSGIKLQNSEVSYSITRNQVWWWSRWGNNAEQVEQVEQGETETDENGSFKISFIPEKTDNATSFSGRFNPSIFSFTVNVSITDVNGETQTNSYNITVGDVSMLLSVEADDKIEKSSDKPINIVAKNLDGNEIEAKGAYQLFSLQENDSIRKQVFQSSFETGNQKELLSRCKKLASGKYRLKLQSKDDRGNLIEAEKDFIVYSYEDKKPPIRTNNWYIVKNATFSPEKPAEIILGVSDKNVYVLYEIWQEKTLLERKWVLLSNENKTFKIPYKTEYKNIVSLYITYIKDEKYYTQQAMLMKKEELKELAVKLDVFRDKLLPGAKEEWRLSVKDPQANPAVAEVLASMYDLSLDKIAESPKWSFSNSMLKNHYTVVPYQTDNLYAQNYKNLGFKSQYISIKDFSFDQFNWFGFSLQNNGVFWVRGRGTFGSLRSTNVSSLDIAELAAPKVRESRDETFALAESKVEFDTDELRSQEEQTETSAPQIRRNFNETAFFYPQLRTNDKGEVQIAFTVPESNTRWKFRVLAHDKNLNSAQTEAIAVSRKELMVTPNMPRFLRQGDVTTISTKISNLSDSTISGTARIILFNPLTDETIPSGASQQQPFSLKAGASENASWTFDVPDNIDLLGVRIIAESESFSDGEQHAIAVLPNKMLVTESVPMNVNVGQTKVFTMDRLTKNASSKTAENYRLTLEFTSNPAWFAVQALPVLSNPDNDNAVNWFVSYYANTLGMYIGKTYPKVSAMIEAWKKQGGNEDTFLSNLEKNEELKNVLLEETPWVLEAKNESEQKRQLSLLFDLNRNQNLTSAAIRKLKELQNENSGWSWYKGFYPNRSITQYILYGFSQLKELDAVKYPDDILSMQKQAISYIDSDALRSFEQMKKYNIDWKNIKTISTSDLEYLYVRSAYPEYPQSDAIKEISEFYTSVVIKNWMKFGLYERSLIAVISQQNGQTAIMQNILKSYREHATVSDEMGMYWANNRARVFMSQSATSVHTFIMDAFRKGGAKANEMDDMKRWLLKQKQTQLWESTHATMDAVHALLSSGSDWFSSQGETKITLGSKTITPEKTETGTGYFKESWSKSEILPEMAKTTVENSGNAPAWGALYLQYFEELDNITKTDASLDIEKMLFVEKTDDSGKKLVRITEENPLKVGDKVIVRLTVRTDRDLEFVHLKDMRASCFEPIEQLSGIKWQNGTIYYQASKDASTNFYFDVLPKGTYVFEYAVYVNRTGSYSNGITTIQCLYAPEFTSHTAGMRINVK